VRWPHFEGEFADKFNSMPKYVGDGVHILIYEKVAVRDARTANEWVPFYADSVATMATLSVRSRSLSVQSPPRFRSSMRGDRTYANRRERPPRDKLGVTGSSPVPPTLASLAGEASRAAEPRSGLASRR
jgi:hypothetical protein